MRRLNSSFLKTLTAVAVAVALARPAPVAAASGDIVLGVTSAFKGTNASLGTELYRGYRAYFDKINAAGGVNGRPIRLVLYDDGYDPPRAVKNTIQMIEKDGVFILFGNVGTPTTVAVLPLLKKFENRAVSLFGPFTGAQPMREEPYVDFSFNVRASYREETEGLVNILAASGKRRIGVLYQSDSYGRSGQDGVARAMKKRGLNIAAEATYNRGTKFEASMKPQIEILQKGGSEAIIIIGAYAAAAAFIRDAREGGFTGFIANISFVGPEAMLALLKSHGQEKGLDLTRGLINSQVVPFYGRDDLPATVEYRQLLDRFNPTVPGEVKDEKYTPARYSFGAMEGFLNAKVLVEVFKKMGEEMSPQSFKSAVESIGSLDIGIDVPVTFDSEDHQGLHKVYFTTIGNGEWMPLPDLSEVIPYK